MHDGTIVLGKEESGVLPNIRMEEFYAQLLGSILFEKRHGFRCKTDRTETAGFWRAYINTLMEYNKKGCNIQIIQETDFFTTVK